VLPIDQDDEVDLCSDEPELAEILADGQISHVKKSKVSELGVVAKDEVDNEDGSGVFWLNEWV